MTPAEVEASYPWTKKRNPDLLEYGKCVRVYLDSPSRLDAPEDAIKLAKQVLRRNAKDTKALWADVAEIGPVSIVESPITQSKPEWKEQDKNWKPYTLYLGWYATEKKVTRND